MSEYTPEDVKENLESLAGLYARKYEAVLDQNRRIRTQAPISIGATTFAFSLIGGSIDLSKTAPFICFAVLLIVLAVQSIATAVLTWPYASTSFLHDDWKSDWEKFVNVTRRDHHSHVAATFYNCVLAEKNVLSWRSKVYEPLISSAAVGPFVVLLAYLFS